MLSSNWGTLQWRVLLNYFIELFTSLILISDYIWSLYVASRTRILKLFHMAFVSYMAYIFWHILFEPFQYRDDIFEFLYFPWTQLPREYECYIYRFLGIPKRTLHISRKICNKCFPLKYNYPFFFSDIVDIFLFTLDIWLRRCDADLHSITDHSVIFNLFFVRILHGIGEAWWVQLLKAHTF